MGWKNKLATLQWNQNIGQFSYLMHNAQVAEIRKKINMIYYYYLSKICDFDFA